MRIPTSLKNADGTPAHGTVVLKNSNGDVLNEYGQFRDGVSATCFALTSPGDVITIHYQLPAGIADYIDVQIDGIIRDSIPYKSEKNFKGSVKKVWHQERLPKGGLGGLKSCVMVVQERDSKHDKVWDGTEAPSNVGSIVLMGPMFDTFASWWEYNSQIDPGDAAPPFEIGFTDRKPPSTKSIRLRAIAKRTGQTEIVGSLQFHLRPTADLTAKGFKDVPVYYAPEPSPPDSPNAAKNTPKIGTSKGKSKGQPSGTSKKVERAKTPEEEESLFVEEETLFVDEDPDPLGISNGGSSKTQSKVFGPGLTSTERLKIMSDKREANEKARAQAAMASQDLDVSSKAGEDGELGLPNPASAIDAVSLGLDLDLDLDLPIDAQEEEDLVDQETIDRLMEPDRRNEPVRAKHSKVKLEPMETDTFADLENRKNGTVLHGMNGSPARQAWRERGATEEAEPEESRQSTPAVEEDSQHPVNNATSSSVAGISFTKRVIEEIRQSSQPLPYHSPLDRSAERNRARRYSSMEPQSLMTPPKSSSKTHSFMQASVGSEIVSRGVKEKQTSARNPSKDDENIFGTAQDIPGRVSGIQQTAKSAPISSDTFSGASKGDKFPPAATSTDISEKSKMNDRRYRQSSQNSPLPDFAPLPNSTSLPISKKPSIAGSETPTETPTEVAPEADIEATRQKHSPRTSEISQNTPKLHQHTSEFHRTPQSAVPQTPESVSGFTGLQIHARSNESPGTPAAQARFHWQGRSPSNEELAVQRQLQGSPSVNRSMLPNSPIPSSPTLASRIAEPQNLLKISAEKRKSEDGSDSPDGQPPLKRVMSTSPGVNSPNSKRHIQAAQARLAAAEKQRADLKAQFEAAQLAAQVAREESNELNRKAEEMERENAELQAQIAALYGEESD